MAQRYRLTECASSPSLMPDGDGDAIPGVNLVLPFPATCRDCRIPARFTSVDISERHHAFRRCLRRDITQTYREVTLKCLPPLGIEHSPFPITVSIIKQAGINTLEGLSFFT